MNEYWDNYEPFDEAAEALKEVLRNSVKDEVAKRIEKLTEQNEALTERLKNVDELEREATSAKARYERELASAKGTAMREVRKEKLGQLLSALDERLFSIAMIGVQRPKCERCDSNRRIEYTTPMGRKDTESCACANRDYHWEAEEVVAHEVVLRDGKLALWWMSERRWGEDDEIGHRTLKPADSAPVEAVMKNPRSYSFESFAAAEHMADLLNEKDAATDG